MVTVTEVNIPHVVDPDKSPQFFSLHYLPAFIYSYLSISIYTTDNRHTHARTYEDFSSSWKKDHNIELSTCGRRCYKGTFPLFTHREGGSEKGEEKKRERGKQKNRIETREEKKKRSSLNLIGLGTSLLRKNDNNNNTEPKPKPKHRKKKKQPTSRKNGENGQEIPQAGTTPTGTDTRGLQPTPRRSLPDGTARGPGVFRRSRPIARRPAHARGAQGSRRAAEPVPSGPRWGVPAAAEAKHVPLTKPQLRVGFEAVGEFTAEVEDSVGVEWEAGVSVCVLLNYCWKGGRKVERKWAGWIDGLVGLGYGFDYLYWSGWGKKLQNNRFYLQKEGRMCGWMDWYSTGSPFKVRTIY